MNIEKYTERARGFIQSAQSLAVRDGHQQFSPLHMLKVLLDDSEGLAGGLIDRAGGNSRAILRATEDALNKLPKVSGSGAGQVYLAPERRAVDLPRRPCRRQLCHCRTAAARAELRRQRSGDHSQQGRRDAAEPERRDRSCARAARLQPAENAGDR